MDQKDLNYALTLKDDASAVLESFKNELNDATTTIQKHSGEVSKMTDFYHTQRSEMRENKFMFREAREVIESLAFATIALSSGNDKAEETTKRFTTSLISSFATFETTQFAISGLAQALGKSFGPWGTIISAVVAAGVGLVSFLKSAQDETKKLVEIHKEEAQVLEEITGLYNAWTNQMKGDHASVVAISKEEQDLLENRLAILSQIINGEKNNKIIINDVGKTQEEVTAQEQMAMWALGKSATEIQDKYKEIQKRLEAVKAAALAVTTVPAPTLLRPKLPVEDWRQTVNASINYNNSLFIDPKTMAMVKDFKEVSKQMSDIFDEGWQTALSEVDNASKGAAKDFYDFFAGNIEGVAGLVRGLAKTIIDQIESIAAQLASQAMFSGILSLLFPEIGFTGFFKSFGGIAGLLSQSAPAPSSPMTGNSARVPAMAGIGGNTYNVTIHALDSASFNSFLRQPDNRNVLISRVNDALRKGITGTLN